MESRLMMILRELTPPLASRGMRSFLQALDLYQPPVVQERDGSWYDSFFKGSASYQGPYRKSPYYFIWCVVVDRVMRYGATSVLDIGCGPGQVAAFLRDRGLKRYCGIDVSRVAIEMARSGCPDFDFLAASVFDTDVFTTYSYDVAICLEFLEHVAEDLDVLKRLGRGTRFLGTVPNFPYTTHVRFFSSCEEVAQRYGDLLDPISVDAFDSPSDGLRFFLLDGIKS